MSWSTSELRVRLVRHEICLSPPVKYFTDRSKAVLPLWIIYVISELCLLCVRTCLFIDVLWSPAGKGLTSWLSFVMSNVCLSLSHVVSSVRCGTWLYRFLIFALFLTFLKMYNHRKSKLYRRSYTSTHGSLNLVKELGKSDKMLGLLSILLLFCNKFDKNL